MIVVVIVVWCFIVVSIVVLIVDLNGFDNQCILTDFNVFLHMFNGFPCFLFGARVVFHAFEWFLSGFYWLC